KVLRETSCSLWLSFFRCGVADPWRQETFKTAPRLRMSPPQQATLRFSRLRRKPRSNRLASYSANMRSHWASAFASKASTKNWLTSLATTHLLMVGSYWQAAKTILRGALLYTQLAAQQLIPTPPEVAAFEFVR